MKFDFTQALEWFNNLDIKARYALLARVLSVFALMDVLFIMGPQALAHAKIEEEAKALSQDIGRVSADKQRILQLKKNLDQSRTKLEAMNLKIRPLQDVPAILEQISGIANEFNVRIDQLMPQKQEQETLITSDDGNYYALPIVIQVRCGYHMFGRFLNKLENQNLYFTVKDLMMTSNENDSKNHLFAATLKVILVDKTGKEKKA